MTNHKDVCVGGYKTCQVAAKLAIRPGERVGQRSRGRQRKAFTFLATSFPGSLILPSPGEDISVAVLMPGGYSLPASPNPDPISDQRCHFPHPFSEKR